VKKSVELGIKVTYANPVTTYCFDIKLTTFFKPGRGSPQARPYPHPRLDSPFSYAFVPLVT
jgi:hypothetical protein